MEMIYQRIGDGITCNQLREVCSFSKSDAGELRTLTSEYIMLESKMTAFRSENPQSNPWNLSTEKHFIIQNSDWIIFSIRQVH